MRNLIDLAVFAAALITVGVLVAAGADGGDDQRLGQAGLNVDGALDLE